MKYRKLYKTLSMSGLLLIELNACDMSDFGDTNISPNSAEVPVTAAMLTDAINDVSQYSGRYYHTSPTLFVQWTSQTQYTEESLYGIPPVGWDGFYVGPLENVQKMIEFNTNEDSKEYASQFGSNNNQIAVARIWKAYLFGMVTDIWGDVPYSQALIGEPNPVYDSQQSIYTDLFKELKEAIAQFDNGDPAQGDILLGGDIAHWKMFANSLRMIFALRISGTDPSMAKTEFEAAYNDAAGFVDENSENVAFQYLDDNNFRSPWEALFDGRDDYAPSDIFVDKLKALNDPRLAVYVNKTTGGEYIGFPYGLTRPDAIAWAAGHSWSRMGDAVTQKTSPGYIITASQMHLALAEAKLKGWTVAGTDIEHYNAAIKASLEQWGVYDLPGYTTYIAHPEVVFTTDKEKKISLQRWISLYPTAGFEAWAEWRRTGYPELTPTPEATNASKEIPRRYRYPSDEITENETGYNSGVSSMGGDEDNTRMWWDQ